MIVNKLVIVFDAKLFISLQYLFFILIQKLLQFFNMQRMFFEIICCLYFELI